MISQITALENELSYSKQREQDAVARLSGDSQALQEKIDREREEARQIHESEMIEQENLLKRTFEDEKASLREGLEHEKYALRQ